MTDESKKPVEEKQVKKAVRKVSTGAWWKSAGQEPTEKKTTASVQGKKGKETVAEVEKKEPETVEAKAPAKSKKQQALPNREARGAKVPAPGKKAGGQKKSARKAGKKDEAKEETKPEQKKSGPREKSGAQGK